MNEQNKSNISKDDLLNVREIIEKEIHQKTSDPFFLSDIISIDTSSLLASSSIRAISIASSTVLPLIFILFLI